MTQNKKNTNTNGKESTKKNYTPKEKKNDVAVKPAQKRNYNSKKPNPKKNYKRPEKPIIPVKIIPLGGLGEIGKNITLYEYDGDMFLVDCGMSFPDEEIPCIDIVIPDFTYILENR